MNSSGPEAAHSTKNPIRQITTGADAFLRHKNEIEFRYVAYDLFSGVQANLQSKLKKITAILGRPALATPLVTIVSELAANALKAVYQKAFFTYVIEEVGWGDIGHDHWMEIFNAELDTNKALNFSRVCREHNLSVQINCTMTKRAVRIDVINDGRAADEERNRLSTVLENAKTLHSMEEILGEEDTSQTGFGLPLIILTLRGLGIARKHFKMLLRKESTVARLEIPYDYFRGSQEEHIAVIEDESEAQSLLFGVFQQLEYAVMVFDTDGSIKRVTPSLLDKLEVDQSVIDVLPALIKAKFFEDIFNSPFGIKAVNQFENYRISVGMNKGDGEWLFNVSGFLQNGNVVTLWQPVQKKNSETHLSEGSMHESMNVQRLVEPYIPRLILEKAHETIRQGQNRLPNISREVTIFFLDLIGFTHTSESLPPHQVIDLLNLAMGIAVRSIEKHSGNIDKFLGDGIMAIFYEPLTAVLAAAEIQNNLFQLNDYRLASEEDPIEARIGINTGEVILGSIGTKRRMDWTALGDVVNTASRIEKQSCRNAVLVSESTYEKVKNHVEVKGHFQQRVKGKAEMISLYFIDSIHFHNGHDLVTLTLPDVPEVAERIDDE